MRGTDKLTRLNRRSSVSILVTSIMSAFRLRVPDGSSPGIDILFGSNGSLGFSIDVISGSGSVVLFSSNQGKSSFDLVDLNSLPPSFIV